jgi:hypothetical protein
MYVSSYESEDNDVEIDELEETGWEEVIEEESDEESRATKRQKTLSKSHKTALEEIH